LRFTPSVMERFGAVGYPYSQHDYKWVYPLVI
jgi:hypothetical protein